MKPRLRLVADDLSGALDTLVQLRLPGLAWPALAVWENPSVEATAFCTDTRDASALVAQKRVATAASWLTEADVAYKKIDSRLRGPVAAEIAAVLAQRPDHAIIVCPALPEQGRIVTAGRVMTHGCVEPVNLFSDLARYGIPCRTAQPGHVVPSGVSFWDAASDSDLDRIAMGALEASRKVILCGSSGLASAVSRVTGGTTSRFDRISGPVLVLIGTDHVATQRQVATVARLSRHPVVSVGPGAVGWEAAADHLAAERSCVVTIDLPRGLDRTVAATQIESILAIVLARVPAPGTLFVTGGATLIGTTRRLGARGLSVAGQIAPGVPIATLVGSPLDGLAVVSKSGGFGVPEALNTILDDAG